MEAYNMDELKGKVKRGTPLTDGEANALKEYLSIDIMSKQSFDFGEIEGRFNGCNFEEMALRERNARWAKNAPSNAGGYVLFGNSLFRHDDCKPAPASSQPFMGPFLTDKDGGGVKRMLNKFFTRLAELKETGKLPI